jgi:hypothetical protein
MINKNVIIEFQWLSLQKEDRHESLNLWNTTESYLFSQVEELLTEELNNKRQNVYEKNNYFKLFNATSKSL